MALRFNGTDAFLEHAAAICTATGYTMAVMVATDKSGPNGEQVCISQGSSTNDAFMTVGFNGSSEGKYATDRADGVGSLTSSKTTSPNISAASFGWLIGAFTSNTSRSVAFGNSTFSTPDTTNSSQNYSHLNRCLIGATRRAAGLLQHAKADLAEAHWFNRILTSGEIDALVAGTAKPEEISGWVDGVDMTAFRADGNYLSMSGTRTFVASGGVTASPLTHPLARSSPASFAGAVTLDNAAPGGSFTTAPASSFAGAVTLDAAAPGGSFGPAPGTFTSQPLNSNNGTTLASAALSYVAAYDSTTGALVARFTGLSTDSLGRFTVSSPLLTPGVTLRWDWETAAGQRRMPLGVVA